MATGNSVIYCDGCDRRITTAPAEQLIGLSKRWFYLCATCYGHGFRLFFRNNSEPGVRMWKLEKKEGKNG